MKLNDLRECYKALKADGSRFCIFPIGEVDKLLRIAELARYICDSIDSDSNGNTIIDGRTSSQLAQALDDLEKE